MATTTIEAECPACDSLFDLEFDPADDEEQEVECPECSALLEIEVDPETHEVELLEVEEEDEDEALEEQSDGTSEPPDTK